MSVEELTPQEVAAALAARRELGPDYEQEIAASLADRMQRRIDTEVLARTGGATADPKRRDELDVADAVTARWTALGSLVAGSAITLGVSGPSGTPALVPVAWLGIVGINLAVNLGRRRRRGRA
jgi:hypothetical protein